MFMCFLINICFEISSFLQLFNKILRSNSELVQATLLDGVDAEEHEVLVPLVENRTNYRWFLC